MYDVNDEFYTVWMEDLEFELQRMRDRRKDGLPKESDGKNTLQKLSQYTDILDMETRTPEIKQFFEKFVESLINPLRKGNRKEEEFSEIRPCELWEHFAEFYLRNIDTQFLHIPNAKDVTHVGRSNDKGADVLCRHDGGIIVVQAKRGFFFKYGKGIDIVQRLIGSMYFHESNVGIIFTNELSEKVSRSVKEVILNAKMNDQLPLKIHVLGLNDLMNVDLTQINSYKKLMVDFMNTYLAKP